MTMADVHVHLVNDPQYGKLNNLCKIMELQAEKARVQNYLSKLNIELETQTKIRDAREGGQGSVFSLLRK